MHSVLPHAPRDFQLRLHFETFRFALQERREALVLYVRPQVGLEDPDQEMGKRENHLPDSLPDPQPVGESDWVLAPRRSGHIAAVDFLRVGPFVPHRVSGISGQGRHLRRGEGAVPVDVSLAGGSSRELSRPRRAGRDFGGGLEFRAAQFLG